MLVFRACFLASATCKLKKWPKSGKCDSRVSFQVAQFLCFLNYRVSRARHLDLGFILEYTILHVIKLGERQQASKKHITDMWLGLVRPSAQFYSSWNLSVPFLLHPSQYRYACCSFPLSCSLWRTVHSDAQGWSILVRDKDGG